MGEVSGQNLTIWFLHISLAIRGKCSKTTRTQEVQGMDTNPFRLFLVSLSCTNWYTSDSYMKKSFLNNFYFILVENVWVLSYVYGKCDVCFGKIRSKTIDDISYGKKILEKKNSFSSLDERLDVISVCLYNNNIFIHINIIIC
jgi:hypothetical protein